MITINSCDDGEYGDCGSYKIDDIDYHVGSDYFDGQLALCMWFVVVVLFVLWYFLELEKPTVDDLFGELPAFHGSRPFSTLFNRVRH
jgi:hypothetical protein